MEDALKAYLDLLALRPSDVLVPLPGEPTVKIRRDIWIRGRISDLLKKATPQHRKQLEEEMRRRLKEAQDRKDTQSLRDFVTLYAGTAIGREAALLLAEQLMKHREFLEADLRLQALLRQGDDPIHMARALELLGQLMMEQGLLPDAVYYYRQLRRDFAKTVLPDGQTGASVWDALSTDKRLLPYLDESNLFFTGKFKAWAEVGSFPMTSRVFQLEQMGEDLPFFRRHLVGLNLGTDHFQLLDRATGAIRWSTRLPPTSFSTLASGTDPRATPRFRYHTRGHLLVLPVDHLIFGIDPVARRVLWRKDLLTVEKALGPNRTVTDAPRSSLIDTDARDASTRIVYPDGWVQHVGQNLVLSSSVLCLVTRKGLQAFDPLTGRLLWMRADMPARSRIFGDEEHVFVVEEDADGLAVSTRVLHLADGGAVPAPSLASQFARRCQLFGRSLLLSEKDDKNTVTLRLYDIPTGAEVWKHTYPARSIVLHSEAPHLTGVVEPDGKVHIVDLRARKDVMTGQLVNPAEHLKNVEMIRLLADSNYFYLACQAPMDLKAVTVSAM